MQKLSWTERGRGWLEPMEFSVEGLEVPGRVVGVGRFGAMEDARRSAGTEWVDRDFGQWNAALWMTVLFRFGVGRLLGARRHEDRSHG